MFAHANIMVHCKCLGIRPAPTPKATATKHKAPLKDYEPSLSVNKEALSSPFSGGSCFLGAGQDSAEYAESQTASVFDMLMGSFR